MHLKACFVKNLFIISGLFGLLLGCGTMPAWAAPHDPPPNPNANNAHNVCTGATLPSGWIVVDHFTDTSQCQPPAWGGGPNNLETIAPPPTTTSTVCSDSPVPVNWVVTNDMGLDLRHCGLSVTNNEKIITPATGSQMTICTSSPIPLSWVVTGEYDRIARPAAIPICGGLVAIQETIAPASGTMKVCQNALLPPGYVVVDHVYVKECLIDDGNSLLIAPRWTLPYAKSF